MSTPGYGWLQLAVNPIAGGSVTLTSNKSAPSDRTDCFVDGNFHHVAMSYDATTGTTKLYYDYEEVDSQVTGPFMRTKEYSTGLYAGMGTSVSDNQWHGGVDEVRWSRTALEPSQFLRCTGPKSSLIFMVR